MSTRNLDKIFQPRSVAVIGASPKQSSIGYAVLQNLVQGGFAGAVHPINPKHSSILGLDVLPSVRQLRAPVDLAIICTPAATIPQLVRECGDAGIRGLVVLSAGFREIGESGRSLEDQISAEAGRFDHLRIIGPNCLGLIVPSLKLSASFANGLPSPGRVAFISQSGALCTAVLDWAMTEGIGFSHFVSIGNMLDVDVGDLIDYFGEDRRTESLILYLESVTNARKFMSAARAFSRTKPIVVYKSGRFADSARAAVSHTGALAGEDAVFDAAFQRAGIERGYDFGEIFDCAEFMARQRLPRGPRLAIVTNAGGPGVIAADVVAASGGVLATLSSTTIERLNAFLPAYWSKSNPVDVLGDADPERFAQAARIVLEDHGVDALLAILTPQTMTDPTATAAALAKVVQEVRIPVLAAWMGGKSMIRGIECLNHAGIATYSTPERAVRAFMHLVSHARNRELLYETPREVGNHFAPTSDVALEEINKARAAGRRILSEPESKALLEAYGLPISATKIAHSADEAESIAEQIGFPVVMKIHSPAITHKTETGGVALDLRNLKDVRAAYQRITDAATRHTGQQETRVTIQPMIVEQDGHELILGSKRDPIFGAVLLLGMGGITAEILGDRALGLPPLNERLTRRMIESLRSWSILKGYRGRPSVDCEQLIETVIAFSHLIADNPEIVEFDINPLLVSPKRVIALDARAVIDLNIDRQSTRPFSHLAIRPYPDQYTRAIQLPNGRQLQLRAIRPEDEPLWHDMLARCSLETLHARFRYSFKKYAHEMATRFCFIDYDRELAIVAEAQIDGLRQFVGIGRLVADANHDSAEYAVLIVDAWQGQGLGRVLTNYCLEIARDWGIQTMTATTERSNHRMQALFRELGFELKDDFPEGVTAATLGLNPK